MIIEKAEEGYRPSGKESQESDQIRSEPELVQERELPPPYAEGSRLPGDLTGTRPDASWGHSVFQPRTQQHVNFVSLYSRHNALSGTYIIDAELPAHAQSPRRKTHMMTNKNVTPNASFETRHGAISLNLATAGGTNVANKTYVQVQSRHGRVNVNMFALQVNKHVCLEIHTRHSPIVLLIPPNFEGALSLSSRRANVKFLPAFAQRARVVTADDKGSHVLFGGESGLSFVEPTSEGLDFCSVSSRHGRITVGVSGVDQLDIAQETSLMKKIGTMVLGPEIMRTMDMLSNPRERQQGFCPRASVGGATV